MKKTLQNIHFFFPWEFFKFISLMKNEDRGLVFRQQVYFKQFLHFPRKCMQIYTQVFFPGREPLKDKLLGQATV